ncbi:MAG: acetyl-coenzyme A synthetase, partial [candidate division WOR-3 bacterium]|nr:acetyl-coenzyme A synthetase [candidate division WOR-3 bacterium]
MAQEKEIYYPPKELVENSNIKKFMDKHGIETLDELLERSRKNIEWWWEEHAKELEWFAPWTKVLEWELPFAKWFINGKINIVHNALDRHIKTYRKNKVAYIYESEPGEVDYWSYYR